MKFLLLACTLEALFLSVRLMGEIRQHIVETIAISLAAGLFYLISSFLILRSPAQESSRKRALWIIAAGVVFRLTVFPLDPGLSDDPFRYRWEGKLQAAGGNPYQVRPNDPDWVGMRDSAFDRVAGKDFKAIYGPLVQLIQRGMYPLAARFEPDPVRQVLWFKLPYALFDLAAIAALWGLLAAHGLATDRVLLYAWSPLTVMEFWAIGHNDSTAVLLVLLALLAAARKRWTWSFSALALATAAKIWPVFLFPIFIGWSGWKPRRLFQCWVALPILFLLALPYWSDVEENARFLSGFVSGWRNNDSLYGLVLWATGDVYRAKKLTLAVIAAASVGVTVLGWKLERAVLTVLTLLLMLSANCHPWYLTWILPLLAFSPIPGLLLWTVLAPLAYATVIGWVTLGEWDGSTMFRWYEYVPVYGLLIGTWVYRYLNRCKEVHW